MPEPGSPEEEGRRRRRRRKRRRRRRRPNACTNLTEEELRG